jgi:hypothetical protein
VDDQKQNEIAGQLRTWAASGTLFQWRHLDVQAYPGRLGEQWRLVAQVPPKRLGARSSRLDA